MRPNLGQVKWIPTECLCLFLSHDLNLQFPFWKIAIFNCMNQVSLGKIRIFTFHLHGFIIDEVFNTLLRFKVKFYPKTFIVFIDKRECMAPKSIHVAITIRSATIRH
ncbi:hypothetical protein D3C86_1475520 [compost metagenome]